MNQNSKLAAWQNLLHKPVEVKEEPIKVEPKVTKIVEALEPVKPAEVKTEPIESKEVELPEPVLEVKQKIKKTKIEE